MNTYHHRLLILLGWSGFCLTLPVLAHAEVLTDSILDFSGVQGQAGWHYGYADGSGDAPWTAQDFHEFPTFAEGLFTPAPFNEASYWTIQEGPGGYWTAMFLDGGMTNGPITSGQRHVIEHWGIRRWISTIDGQIAISGIIGDEPQSCGDGIRAVIRVDGINLLSRETRGNTPGWGYAVVATVSVGSTVDLVAQPKANDYCDDYRFTARIFDAADSVTLDTQWIDNGHWYRAVHVPGGAAWLQTDRAATAIGGYLATPTSVEENGFVFGLVDAPVFWQTKGGGLSGTWLGGVQSPCPEEPLCGWGWVTGEPWSYVNWQVDQPDNANANEDRLHFSSPDNVRASTWDDAKSDLFPRGCVIEFDSKPYVSPLPKSTFDSGMDGWSTYGDGADLLWDLRNGNPGGCVIAVDRVLGINNGFLAPASFRGNHRVAYGGVLRYDIHPVSPAAAVGWEVLLSGGGITLTIDPPDSIPNTWNTRILRLDATAGWMESTPSGPAAPTELEFQTLLSNLSAIQIAADFLTGADATALDNVVLAVRYDLDVDGDVDADDFAILEACVTGPAVPYNPLPFGCTLVPDLNGLITGDFDRDGDVDDTDFGMFQRCYGGKDQSVDRLCEN